MDNIYNEGYDKEKEFQSLLLNRFGWILDIEDNFDGEGSPKYNLSTLKRAGDFLYRHDINYEKAFDDYTVDIMPGPYGSLDVSLSYEGVKKVYINFPENSTKDCNYYGDNLNYVKNSSYILLKPEKISGVIKEDKIYNWLLMWLRD